MPSLSRFSRKPLKISRGQLSDDNIQTSRDYNNLAGNLQAQGEYALAQPLFERALEISRRLLTDDDSRTATIYNNVATNLNAQGKYALAQPLHERALEIRRRLLTDNDILTTKSYNDLAVNLNLQRKYADAQPLFEKALKINRSILSENHERTALAYNNLGENLGAQGEYVVAQPLLETALKLRIQLLTDDHPDTAESYENVAANLDAQGKYTRAQPLHERSLEIFRRVLSGDHPGAVKGFIGLANNLNAQGKYLEAKDRWQHGVKSLDTARLRIAFAGLDRAGNLQSPRPALASVLARLGRPAEAWQTLEENLGRGLLDELDARHGQRLTPGERDRLSELTTALDQLDRLVETSPNGLDQAVRAKRFEDLIRQRELASIALGDLQSELVRVHGSLEGKVARLDEIQASLPADTALVAWVDIPPIGPNAADPDGEHWGVVVRSRGVPSWIPITGTEPHGLWSEEDTGLAIQVRSELRKSPGGDTHNPQPLIERLRAQRLLPLARALGASTTGMPAAQTLIVLPSRDMAGIPVEALLANEDTRTVSYAPSATVFKSLLERPRRAGDAGLLALGNPIYGRPSKASDPDPPDHGLVVNVVAPGSNAATCGLKPGDVLLAYNGQTLNKKDDLKIVAEGNKPIVVDVWREGRSSRRNLASGALGAVIDSRPAPEAIVANRAMDDVLTAARSGSEVFAPLPESRNEVEALARLFRADHQPARVLLGPDASEPELDRLATSGELGRFRAIHLATHAVINDGVPSRSAAILTQSGLPDPLQQALNNQPVFDGRLSVREIQRGWEIKAELVTLSACETALGRNAGGEGFVGFTQALLMSGARSVCLSLWKVDDRATSLFMKRFYQNWLGKRPGLNKPVSKAEALHDAKQWLREWTDEKDKLAPDQNPRGEVRIRDRPRSAQPKARPYEHPYFWAGFILVGDPS